MFTVAVLLALLKLGGLSGAKPLFLRMVPTTPIAKAAEPAVGEREAREDKVLDLPDADGLVPGPVGHLLTITSRVANLSGREESAGSPRNDGAPVFYRPSSEGTRGTGGGVVCGNLGDFPKSSGAVFPLPGDYFDSYEDTWGAARPQGGHEGTDLMSPTGTPEFAITDGTLVLVKGANENGWNRLGGYTVMLEAAYDAGPIKKGDLFYYAHMEEESALKVGTKVQAGQQIGVVGDTGEGREGTRGKFPPHLHLGWYDAGSAGSRTNLETGAMKPYPLLLWLEDNGGAITGGVDASYCEASQEPVPDSSGTSPDLDTGDWNDARPSPVVGESRQDYGSPERESGTGEKNDGTNERSERANAAGGDPEPAGPTNRSEKDDEAGDGHVESPMPGDNGSASSEGQASGLSAEDGSLQAKVQVKPRTLLQDTWPSADPASRRSYVWALVDMLRKAEKKNERDGRDADTPDKKKQTDKKKQKNQKKSPKSPARWEESQKNRSAPETTPQRSRPAAERDAPDHKKDPKVSPAATELKGRTSSAESTPARETPREVRNGER